MFVDKILQKISTSQQSGIDRTKIDTRASIPSCNTRNRDTGHVFAIGKVGTHRRCSRPQGGVVVRVRFRLLSYIFDL